MQRTDKCGREGCLAHHESWTHDLVDQVEQSQRHNWSPQESEHMVGKQGKLGNSEPSSLAKRTSMGTSLHSFGSGGDDKNS